ncbi:hypothetical protein QN360_00810 [Glaciimonas sp. CA11.2]|uniref:hypothetical protein n=1 Tax=Glaciimonas sp. Cout2 TaxID=3048621 RepID=UPI002B22605E|nr:hypothetical protein [Glaciimonas sp. Cout2]MEB0014466.1 hypothetical protein [Glaciimonas sp. Cout2]MEB0161447.1 hypothetical protein [Glaciimonas sp. CA11.2]
MAEFVPDKWLNTWPCVPLHGYLARDGGLSLEMASFTTGIEVRGSESASKKLITNQLL